MKTLPVNCNNNNNQGYICIKCNYNILGTLLYFMNFIVGILYPLHYN